MAIYAHALSVHFALMNTTSALESQFAAIIINIHLGRAARVEQAAKTKVAFSSKAYSCQGCWMTGSTQQIDVGACRADLKTDQDETETD